MATRQFFPHPRHTLLSLRLIVILSVCLLLGCPTPGFVTVTDPMPPPPRPAMGWSSWYGYQTHISDQLIRQQAEAMLSNGMRQAGYEYVNIDDGWQGYRDAHGFLHPNSSFPDMKALGDYLHSLGFKFGIYTSLGKKSCDGLVGSFGHEAQDAQTFIDWGVDFVKYDLCNLDAWETAPSLVGKMSTALRKNEKHPVVLSIVVLSEPWQWAPRLAVNMWRIAPDETGSYKNMLRIADADARLAPFAGNVGWNDPDMLLVGAGGLTLDENRTQMTLWAMLAAPLISSTDLLHLNSSQLEILTDAHAIAVNQDPEVKQATIVKQSVVDVWRKRLADGWAIAIINRKKEPVTYVVDPNDLGIQASEAYEIWTKQTVTLPSSITVAAHGCVFLKTL
jgi:alpha-galactosidase